VNEHADQLREAFESHEYLAPDAGAVYTRAQELARTYRRRRLAAQAAGGAVLGVGLLAGGVALPDLLPGGAGQAVIVQGPASGAVKTTPPSQAELQRDWDAYFAAGYGYTDAQKLAKIWMLPGDVGSVKAEAGRRLLAGETLPIKPSVDPDPVVTDPQEVTEVDAFFKAGYDYADAQRLSQLWKTTDPYDAKVMAGQKLLSGEPLPFAP